uniref:site-specific DNA-methyltransferase (adenine-specific) n=1 Tax=Candidatus Kentrum sp. TC TaxID=2126339 RepID=A0A450ZZH0_9GAMM|nr:MAG: Type II restriction/modification system, DNA methylase subunit YeeA [Candidatus Kentron sp. TC]
MPTQPFPIDPFLERWRKATGAERANHQLFITELCQLLDLPPPDPARDDDTQNAYIFERRVDFHHPDGATRRGFIDCYKRGAFVLEAKHTGKTPGTGKWDKAMLRAHGQAVAYARALPKEEGRPPFVITLDVGVALEVYSEFTQSGGAYVPYPDPRAHRIRLSDLRDERIRERLRAIWLEPLALDPTRLSARVTRDIAARLATLAKSLEQSGNPSAQVANFLMRAIFTMFAEDVGLIDNLAFTELLESLADTPEHFAPMVEELWRIMNSGGFSTSIRKKILQFNGGLFADPAALELDREQVALLIDAARADWRNVEPAIFGTLLERALDPLERHKLGAHYTPRAYVERLVMPTVIEPLRLEWENTQTTAALLDQQGKHKKAVETIKGFHIRLCGLRILDPACGSGNFLYVTLEHLKRLEGEILDTLEQLGETQTLLEMEGVTVDPHQFLGLETNPRAAAIAEAVIWIGYLQWHFRTRGDVAPPEPVLREFKNIQNRDAVLAWDAIETATDENGAPLTRWDGRTTKQHPVTGEQVPDESARVAVERYVNPRKAGWPEADFVVGNPPFIGAARMRAALGDGYAQALRDTYPRMPESADLVMYWWHHAADLVRAGKLRRFGLITTNSLRQTFNRRVIQHHMAQKKPISLRYAVPDHPWVDSADGAQVRIAMTVAEAGEHTGILETVIAEKDAGGEGREVECKRRTGKLFADLKVGADVAGSKSLLSHAELSFRGVILIGTGFMIEANDPLIAKELQCIKPYLNGRDLNQITRDCFVIDFFGYSVEEIRSKFPSAYQRIIERVKPEREQNRDQGFRDNWWLHGRPRSEFRAALVNLPRYIATAMTAKHRTFTWIDSDTLPDQGIIAIAQADAVVLGILSSRLHVVWSLAAGGTLEDRPRYNNTRCFETFPFPDSTPAQKDRIRDLAEQIDRHRKRQQEQHTDLTLTGIYNVLEKLRKGEQLTAKERTTHDRGLVSVLRQLHDELDRAVFDAYGWGDLAERLVGEPGATTPWPEKPDEQTKAEEELLQRLVDLNYQRAAEEQRGLVRWLRPEYQNPQGATATQGEAELDAPAAPVATTTKTPWPKTIPQQVETLRAALRRQPQPVTPGQLAKTFKGARTKRVWEILDTLVAMGQGREEGGRYAGT